MFLGKRRASSSKKGEQQADHSGHKDNLGKGVFQKQTQILSVAVIERQDEVSTLFSLVPEAGEREPGWIKKDMPVPAVQVSACLSDIF